MKKTPLSSTFLCFNNTTINIHHIIIKHNNSKSKKQLNECFVAPPGLAFQGGDVPALGSSIDSLRCRSLPVLFHLRTDVWKAWTTPISSEDRAIVQVETLETLMVWTLILPAAPCGEGGGVAEAHNTLDRDNLADGYLLYRAAALLSPEPFRGTLRPEKLLEAFAPGSDGAVTNASQIWIKRSSLLKAFSNSSRVFPGRRPHGRRGAPERPRRYRSSGKER